jgi:hypothetical protein
MLWLRPKRLAAIGLVNFRKNEALPDSLAAGRRFAFVRMAIVDGHYQVEIS